jgi:hypothetical protein
VAVLYTLVPEGRWRNNGKWVVTGLVALAALSRIALGADAPTDVLVGVALGVTFPLVAFRWFAPIEIFPITYRRGSSTHLDVSGPRGTAVRWAPGLPGEGTDGTRPCHCRSGRSDRPLAEQIAADLPPEAGDSGTGADCGDVRSCCWQIAGKLGLERSASSPEVGLRAPLVQCCPRTILGLFRVEPRANGEASSVMARAQWSASIRGSCPGRGRSTVGVLRLSWLEAGVANDCILVHAPRPFIETLIMTAGRVAPSRGLFRSVAGAA